MHCAFGGRGRHEPVPPHFGTLRSYRAGGASRLPRNNLIALIYCYAHIAQLVPEATTDQSHNTFDHRGAIVQVVPGATAKKFHSTLDHRGAVAQVVRGLLRNNRLAVFDQLRVILAEVHCCCALPAQQCTAVAHYLRSS